MNYVVVFCVVCAVIVAAIYMRHHAHYPKDFKILQMPCKDLNYDVLRSKYPIVVEDVDAACLQSKFPMKCLRPEPQPQGIRTVTKQFVAISKTDHVDVFHPDDADYVKVELMSGSTLLVPRGWNDDVTLFFRLQNNSALLISQQGSMELNLQKLADRVIENKAKITSAMDIVRIAMELVEKIPSMTGQQKYDLVSRVLSVDVAGKDGKLGTADDLVPSFVIDQLNLLINSGLLQNVMSTLCAASKGQLGLNRSSIINSVWAWFFPKKQ
eukprot:gene19689-26376_t